MQISSIMLLFIGITIPGARYACFYRTGNNKPSLKHFRPIDLWNNYFVSGIRRVGSGSLSFGTTLDARLYGRNRHQN
jgi:hypothetical protein